MRVVDDDGAGIARPCPKVRFMLEALEKAGCPVQKNFFQAW
jgi:hypothetical protein